jgi:hypothetical protein
MSISIKHATGGCESARHPPGRTFRPHDEYEVSHVELLSCLVH